MSYFTEEGDVMFYNNAEGPPQESGLPERCMKAVLLNINCKKHENNLYNMKLLLEKKIKYSYISADLKFVAMIRDCKKDIPSFLVLNSKWDSRVIDKHYLVKNWPRRTVLIPVDKSVSQNL